MQDDDLVIGAHVTVAAIGVTGVIVDIESGVLELLEPLYCIRAETPEKDRGWVFWTNRRMIDLSHTREGRR